MRIIQTFWSGDHDDKKLLDIKAGWKHSEYNWMSWALSSILLRRKYEKLELYTDKIGKRILIDFLKLPYTKVHIVFDEEFKIHSKLFALAKIKTYSLQKEPFIHVDGDVFLWNSIPEKIFDAELMASNLELNLYFNKEVLEGMEEHFQYIPNHLKDVCQNENIYSSNAGIFGGSNLTFIKEYCSMAEQIIKKNEVCLEKVEINFVNMLIEQISLFYMAAKSNVKTTFFITEPVENPLYEDLWRFADVPEVPMIHPMGISKKLPYVIHHLGRRLQMEAPEVYYRIISICKNQNIQLRDRLYDYLDLDFSSKFCDSNIFKKALNFSKLESLKPEMNQVYRRTWLVVSHYYPETKFVEKDLRHIIQQNSTNSCLQEIYYLETQNLIFFERLLIESKKGDIYRVEEDHYKSTTNFVKDANWTKRKVVLKDILVLLKLSKPWNRLKDPDTIIQEVLDMSANEYCVTLSIDLPTFSIREGYHEELDAIIITLIRKPIYIEDILCELAKYFDEEIEISNLEYQLLIFDVLKRLAFENIIVFLD